MKEKMNFKVVLVKLLEGSFFGVAGLIGLLSDNRISRSLGFIYRRSYWKTKLKLLGTDVAVYPNVIIHNPDKVVIGNHCSIDEFVHVWGGCGVTIGNNVMIASNVSITSSTHSPDEDIMRNLIINEPVVIEDNVWIGTHAVILPGVTIKRGSVVAAGAVVITDVPQDVIVAGVPAQVKRHIKRSSSE